MLASASRAGVAVAEHGLGIDIGPCADCRRSFFPRRYPLVAFGLLTVMARSTASTRAAVARAYTGRFPSSLVAASGRPCRLAAEFRGVLVGGGGGDGTPRHPGGALSPPVILALRFFCLFRAARPREIDRQVRCRRRKPDGGGPCSFLRRRPGRFLRPSATSSGPKGLAISVRSSSIRQGVLCCFLLDMGARGWRGSGPAGSNMSPGPWWNSDWSAL